MQPPWGQLHPGYGVVRNGFNSPLQNPVVNMVQGNQAGTYSVVANNSCGSSSASVQLTVNSSPSNVSASISQSSVCTGSTVNLSASANGNINSWIWSGPNGFTSSSQNPSLNITQTSQSGTYTVTSTNNCGSGSSTVQLTVNTVPLNVTATSGSSTTCIGSTINLSSSASGTVNNWSWSGTGSFNSTSQNPSVIISQLSQGGNYMVSATNNCGSSTASVQVNVNAIPSNVVASSNLQTVCIGSTLNLSGSASGTGNSWSWTGPAGFTSTAQNPSVNITQANQAGNYAVTVSNNCGASSASLIINVATTPLNVLASSNTNNACISGTLNLSGTATGAVSNWNWTGPGGFTSGNQNPSLQITNINQSGNYSVIASNACGSSTASVIVNVISAPSNVVATSTSTTACIGTSISFTGTASGQITTWNWTGPNGYSSSQQNPTLAITQQSQQGTYQVSATNNCGSSTASVSVNVNSTPLSLTASVSSPDACIGTSISLSGNATGSVTGWNWTGPAGFSSSNQNPVLNLTQTSQSGQYFVTATTVCGSLTASVQVNAQAPPSGVVASAGSSNLCVGSSVNLTGIANGSVNTWSWTGPNAFTSPSQNPVINVLQQSHAGNYIVIATNDCGSSSASVNLNVNSLPLNVVASSSSNSICTGNTITLNATAGNSVTNWNWNGPNGFISAIQNPSLLISLSSQAGSYTVTASNICGNNSSSVVIAIGVPPLNVNATTNNTSPCTGSSISLNGNSGNAISTWSWNGPNGYSSASQNPVISIAQLNQAGQYTVTATNSCGSTTAAVSITVNTTPSNVVASAGSPVVCTGSDLILTGSANGGVTNWNWTGPSGFVSSLQNPVVSISQSNQSGNYILTAANICGSSSSTVNVPVIITPANVTATSSSTTPCTGTTINLASNATGIITAWSWNGPSGFTSTQQNPQLNVSQQSQSGSYVVIASNSCGTASASVLLNVNTGPVNISANANTTNICTGSAVTFDANATGSVSTWSWTGPNGFTSALEDPVLAISQLSQAGTYTVTATTGCGSTSASVILSVSSAPLNLVSSSSSPSACIGTTFNLNSSATGPVTNWSWTGPVGFTSGLQNPALLISQTSQSGIYTVTATNNCGSVSSSVQVLADSLLAHPVASLSSGIVCAGNSVTLQAIVTGNVMNWNWTGPGGFSSPVQNSILNVLQLSQAGNYIVTATNDCGSTSASVQLIVNDKPSNLVATTNSNSVCLGSTINLNGNANGIVTGWSWTGPNGFTSNQQNPSVNITLQTQAGVYTVTSSNDCGSINAALTLSVDSGPVNPLATANSNDVCTGSTLELEGFASGLVTNWSWTGPNGFISSLSSPDLLITNSSQAGVYTMTASDICGSTSSSIVIMVHSAPASVVATASVNNICPGSNVELQGHAFGQVTDWSWTGPNGFSSDMKDTILVNVQQVQSGIYILTAANNCGGNSSSVNLVIQSSPSLMPLAISSNYIVVSLVTSTDHVQWFYNNNVVQGNDNDSLPCLGDGDYYSVVTNSAGCSSTSGIISVSNCSTVGISGDQLLAGLSLYPNPAHDKIWLIGNLKNDNYSVEILNVLGEVVIIEEFRIRNNYIDKEFFMENFAAGIYLLNIRSVNSKAAFRIIKE